MRFVLLLSLFNGISVQAARVVVALYALELGATPFIVGVLGGMFSLFPLLLAVKAGRLVDRFGSFWLIAFGASAGALGMAIAYWFAGLPALLVASAMMGFSLAFFNLSMQILVGLLSAPQDRARNYSNYSLMTSISSFAGPLLAGFSIDHSGHALACLYVALFSAAPVALLPIGRHRFPRGSQGVASTGSGITALLSERGVTRTLISGSLQNAGEILFQFYMPVYAHSLGLSASATGVILAMNSAAAFAMRLALPRLIAWFDAERVLSYAFYIGAASMLLMPAFKSAALLAVMSFAFGVGMGCGAPIVTMLMFGNAPSGRSGEALGLKMTANHFTKMVAPIVFGSIASAFGLFSVFWINALMLGAGGVLSRSKER